MLDRWTMPAVGVPVDIEKARRIAVRAQGLDGSAERRARDRAPARLPPARPDLDRRAAAAPRPLEPARRVRHRGVRPAALGGAEARRVACLPLPDRGSADSQGVHAAQRPADRRAPPRVAPRRTRAFSRYVLKELRERGPLLSREIEMRPSHRARRTTAGGAQRQMGLMLEVLAGGREGRRRRPPRQAARLGSRRALVSRDARRCR